MCAVLCVFIIIWLWYNGAAMHLQCNKPELYLNSKYRYELLFCWK